MEEEAPESWQQTEGEPKITEDQALAAMKAEEVDIVRDWYLQELENADSTSSDGGRPMVSYWLGRMQVKAGFLGDGLESLNAAKEDAANQGNEALVATINEAIRAAVRSR